MNRLNPNILITILLTLFLVACGGGGGSSDTLDSGNSTPQNDNQSGSDAGAPVVSSGVITGFGSVFVNGVEFETGSATVSTDDDDFASEDDLEVGMVVTITGTVNEDGVTGEASEIEYEEELQGKIEEVFLEDDRFIVLGQTVRIDDLTNFEGLTFESMQAGQFVEISGIVDADGIILASLVKLEDMDDESETELKLEGTISNFDLDTMSFELNGLTVDFSAAEFKKGTSDDLADDVVVRVKSKSDIVEGILLADIIVIKEKEDDDDDDVDDGDPVVIDGIIDSLGEANHFTVNGHSALVNDETDYHNDSSIDDLVLNQRIRIKGVLNIDGVIVVEHLTLKARHYLSMEGEIEAVDSTSEPGTLTMLGYTFIVTEDTHFIDSGEDRVRYFDLTDLFPGDRVEIKAEETDVETEFVAVKIKRHHDDDTDKIKLSGPATEINVDLEQFLLDGFLIKLGDDTEFGIHNGDDFGIEDFFWLLEEEFTVKVEGYMEGDTVIAVEVRLKKTTEEHDDSSSKTEEDDHDGEEEDGKAEDDDHDGEEDGKAEDDDHDGAVEDEKSDDGVVEDDESDDGVIEDDKSDDGAVEDDKSDDGVVEDDKSDDGVVEDDKSDDGVVEDDKSDDGAVEGDEDGGSDDAVNDDDGASPDESDGTDERLGDGSGEESGDDSSSTSGEEEPAEGSTDDGTDSSTG
jgi:hypothetical protein